MSLFKKNKKKQIIKNIKYEDVKIDSKKRQFSKIELDPYALDYEKDDRSYLLKLKDYFYGVWKELYIIKWQQRKKTWQDFKMVVSLVICLIIFMMIVDVIFIILRAKGVI